MGKLAFSILVVVTLSGCTSENPSVRKAIEVHNESVQLGEQVESEVQSLEVDILKLPEPERKTMGDSVRQLKSDLADWQSNLVEVPGHDHDHQGHLHDHHHEPAPDLTPEMILEIQEELRDRIIQLNVRSQRLLNEVKGRE